MCITTPRGTLEALEGHETQSTLQRKAYRDEHLLEEVERLQAHTRRSLGAPWFPLVLFGGLTMLSALFVSVSGPGVLVIFWPIAGALAMAAIHGHYRRRGRARGLSGPKRQWWLGAGLFAASLGGALVGGRVAGTAAALVVPIAATFAAYVLFGWLQHNPVLPAAVAVAAGIAAGLALAGGEPWVVEVAFGAGLMGAGIVVRGYQAVR
jgi:hypothetical protein